MCLVLVVVVVAFAAEWTLSAHQGHERVVVPMYVESLEGEPQGPHMNGRSPMRSRTNHEGRNGATSGTTRMIAKIAMLM